MRVEACRRSIVRVRTQDIGAACVYSYRVLCWNAVVFSCPLCSSLSLSLSLSLCCSRSAASLLACITLRLIVATHARSFLRVSSPRHNRPLAAPPSAPRPPTKSGTKVYFCQCRQAHVRMRLQLGVCGLSSFRQSVDSCLIVDGRSRGTPSYVLRTCKVSACEFFNFSPVDRSLSPGRSFVHVAEPRTRTLEIVNHPRRGFK
jgi:hypothetical protein